MAGNTGGRWHKCRWQQWRVAVVSPVKAQEMATVGEAVKEAREGRGNSDSSEGYSRGSVLLMADRGAVDAVGRQKVGDTTGEVVALTFGDHWLCSTEGLPTVVAGSNEWQMGWKSHKKQRRNIEIVAIIMELVAVVQMAMVGNSRGEGAGSEGRKITARQQRSKDGEKLQQCGRCNSDDSDSGVVCKGSSYGVTTRMPKIAALIPIDKTPQDPYKRAFDLHSSLNE
ncbi:hypothetical protein B296_00025139 [Ensete ventricosum]|uniref:Uncharacterized protein n=1 Tax=Ensete ventricosum TaxID=4639 RepID=A0A426YKC3_ENSVE|nr:hypothetical protein B296_00025139 [Ensete ventricosum]